MKNRGPGTDPWFTVTLNAMVKDARPYDNPESGSLHDVHCYRSSSFCFGKGGALSHFSKQGKEAATAHVQAKRYCKTAGAPC